MLRLKRKIDEYLLSWKDDEYKLPLIVKGARQIGKTEALENFGQNNYKSVVEINFILEKQYKSIFDDDYNVDTIIKNISLINPDFNFIPGETLIFFDEIQDCLNAATSLKAFNKDGRYDVICSRSLMGINYKELESNSVGNKEDYEMYSLDFEEFLWYKVEQIEELYSYMVDCKPIPKVMYDVMLECFHEYMIVEECPRSCGGLLPTKIIVAF